MKRPPTKSWKVTVRRRSVSSFLFKEFHLYGACRVNARASAHAFMNTGKLVVSAKVVSTSSTSDREMGYFLGLGGQTLKNKG